MWTDTFNKSVNVSMGYIYMTQLYTKIEYKVWTAAIVILDTREPDETIFFFKKKSRPDLPSICKALDSTLAPNTKHNKFKL